MKSNSLSENIRHTRGSLKKKKAEGFKKECRILATKLIPNQNNEMALIEKSS